MDPEKALEAKERGNEQYRAGQWALAINEYEEVISSVYCQLKRKMHETWYRLSEKFCTPRDLLQACSLFRVRKITVIEIESEIVRNLLTN